MSASLLAAQNPLLPAGYDLLWSGIIAVVLGLTVAALWQALRSKAHTGTRQLLWALVVVAAPVLGSLAWFVLGRARATPPAAHPQPLAPHPPLDATSPRA